MKNYLRAFPDVVNQMDEQGINGAQAVLVWTLRGTHRGRFMHIPPTGRRVNVRRTTVMTICEGRIHRVVWIRDVAGLLRGISQLPDL